MSKLDLTLHLAQGATDAVTGEFTFPDTNPSHAWERAMEFPFGNAAPAQDNVTWMKFMQKMFSQYIPEPILLEMERNGVEFMNPAIGEYIDLGSNSIPVAEAEIGEIQLNIPHWNLWYKPSNWCYYYGGCNWLGTIYNSEADNDLPVRENGQVYFAAQGNHTATLRSEPTLDGGGKVLYPQSTIIHTAMTPWNPSIGLTSAGAGPAKRWTMDVVPHTKSTKEEKWLVWAKPRTQTPTGNPEEDWPVILCDPRLRDQN